MSKSTLPIAVTIASEAPFLSAIDRYADENKPDPLSLKQLKGLSVEWENQSISAKQDQQQQQDDDFSFEPSQVLCGTLSITGEYMAVRLWIQCAWTVDESDPKYGNLSYTCRASASLLPKSTRQSKDKQAKVEEKIRSKMQKRLQKDAYISKLFVNKEETRFSSWPVFCSAEIRFFPNDLEERVDTSGPIAEAIKRAVWSAAESNLDIVDLLLNFPSLPCRGQHKEFLVASTELANRAKLRLLEDAMLDACEQEGEDQILEDLSIDNDESGGDKKVKEQDHDNGITPGESSRETSRSKRSRQSQ